MAIIPERLQDIIGEYSGAGYRPRKEIAMRFDFTKGKTAVYMVSIYTPDGCDDHLYYHYYKEAMEKFQKLKNSEHYEKGTSFSIYDMNKDVRKEYCRI